MSGSLKNLPLALNVAEKAKDLYAMDQKRRSAALTLKGAYRTWRHKTGLLHVKKDTPEYIDLMQATAGEYFALRSAKRQVQNARKRLETAVKRMIEATA